MYFQYLSMWLFISWYIIKLCFKYSFIKPQQTKYEDMI